MAGSASRHWLGERIKSAILLPLTIAMLWIVVPLIGADFATAKAALSAPLAAILLILFFAVTAKHLEEGLQVVIEDYVHAPAMFGALTWINRLFSWGVGLIAIFALIKIAFLGA